MKRLVSRKNIVIPHKAFIPPLNAYGPIEMPYMETLEKIAQIIQLGIKVQEVQKDGTKVTLDMLNFDKKINDKSSLTSGYESLVQKPFGKKKAVTVISDEDVENKSVEKMLTASTEKLAAPIKKKKVAVARVEDDGEPHKRYLEQPTVDAIDEK